MQYAYPGMAILFGLVLPAALLAWVLGSRAKSRLYLASVVLLAALALAAIAGSMFGVWHVVGVFWPPVFLLALAAIVALRLRRRLPRQWAPRRWEAALTVLNLLHAGLWGALLVSVVQARFYAGVPLDLAPPLRGGTFYVISGGTNLSTNQHAAAATSRYALDIGRLNAFGFGADGLFPKDLRRYPVFGAQVVAPCAGEVISTRNDKPNQPPLHPDGADRSGGNHVAIFCQGATVSLFHLQAGTVTVKVGDRVTIGQPVGRVGSSGNSMHPHLHIQAVRGRRLVRRGEAGVESQPLRIGGRLLVKGDSFKN